MYTYVIADIHGQYKMLENLLMQLENPSRLIFLGDYIDKGEDSKKVIQFLLKFSKYIECIFLCGNHEYYLKEYMFGAKDQLKFFRKYGGKETMQSYIKAHFVTHRTMKKMLLEMKKLGHLDFIKGLKMYYIDTKNHYFISHAGFDPNENRNTFFQNIPFNMKSFINSRWDFINCKQCLGGNITVFGHTGFNLPYVDDYKIGIDTGAAYDYPLTAYCLESRMFVNSNGQSYDLEFARNTGGILLETK